VLKEHLRACSSTIHLELCWRVRSLLVAALTPALRQGFPSQSHFMCRPKKSTPLEAWISDGSVWTHEPSRLCGNPKFDADMRKPVPWEDLQIFSKLALNNAGRRAKRVIARYFCRTMHQITIFIGCSERDRSTHLILPFSRRRRYSRPPRPGSSAPLSAPSYAAVTVIKWPGSLVLNVHSALLSLAICLL
jgi:hypothetical protein